MFSGNYGSVISFSPNYTGGLIAPQFATAANITGLDNTISVYGADANYADDRRIFHVPQYGGEDAEFSQTIDNMWYKRNVGSYKATLTIAGDPTIEPLQYINVLPFRPDGKLHFSAGTYQVIKVTDNIISGFYTTELELLRSDKYIPTEPSGRGINSTQNLPT